MLQRHAVLFAGCVFFAASLGVNRVLAQIPNSGFENWTNGNPDGWSAFNDPPFYVTITQVTGRTGSAAQGTVVDFHGFPYPPSLTSSKFPITTRPAGLHGWYEFTGVGTDVFKVVVAFTKNGAGIAGGNFTATTAQSTFGEFIVNITWPTGDNPDTGVISMNIYNSALTNPGSFFVVDDLAFGATGTGVREAGPGIPQQFSLHQNYPNPFNPSTTIQYELPKAVLVTLKVFNALGQEVATLVDENKPAGVYTARFDAGALGSGVYFYKLTAGNFVETRKMIMLK